MAAVPPGSSDSSSSSSSSSSGGDSGGYSVEQCLRVLASKVNTARGRAALAVLRGELGDTERGSRASDRFKKGRPARASQQSSGGDMPSKGSVRRAFGGNQ